MQTIVRRKKNKRWRSKKKRRLGGKKHPPLPDDEEIHRREEHYQQLPQVVGVGGEADGDTTPLGFSSHSLDEIQAIWSPLAAGELLARVGHFVRILSQILEEVGYMAEALARRHRGNPEEEGDETNLVQGEKRRKPGTHRRRTITGKEEDMPNGEEPASSSNVPQELPSGERSTRRDPIPREEHLTAEDWVIMAAVEKCTVWRSLKALNLRQREKLLAAICMGFQETVEGNTDGTTVNSPDDFRDWGRRWGEDQNAAQMVMQNQWDNLLRHIMGITAAMEVWEPSTSSSSAGGDAHEPGENQMNASEVDGNLGESDQPAQCGGDTNLLLGDNLDGE